MNELLSDPETVHHIRTGKTSYSELRALTGLSYSTIYRKVKNVIPEPLEIAQ
jgi:predicted DNA-binding transcriptional regulator AlpA